MKILQIKTRGVKNIEKDLTISFCNATIENGIKNVSKIKGIYGYNGAGKSAFITSIELYKKISTDRDYLLSSYNQSKLLKLINKNIKEYYIEFIFQEDEDEKPVIYKHSVLLSYDKIELKFKIATESFDILKGRTLNTADLQNIFIVKNGNILFNTTTNSLIRNFYVENIRQSNGTALVNSLFIKVLAYFTKNKQKNFKFEELEKIIDLYALPAFISTYLLSDDKHEPKRIDTNLLNKLFDALKKSDKQLNIDEFLTIETNDEFEENVNKKQLPVYEAQTKHLENFIKIFKPELKRIIIDKKVENEVIHCRRIFDYGKNLQIDVEYESSGIKHLIQLHKYLQEYINGEFVFIDEIDVNINSVFLCKLIDFLSYAGKGQLCFTSHNLEPMNTIKNIKASICAIGYDGNLDVWVKNGNKSPSSDYYKGEFEHSPFNVESFDFYSCFKIEENE